MKKPPELPEHKPLENYIQEQYSPKALRKKVVKSKSVDVPYLIYNAQNHNPKTVKQTASSYLVNTNAFTQKSPEFNKKVQFLSIPNRNQKQRRSRSPIQAVANLFKKSDNTVTDNSVDRKKSISKIVKNIGSKLVGSDNYLKVDHGLDSSSDDTVDVYRARQGNHNVENKPNAHYLKQTFRKLSHGTVNLAKSLGLSNEKLTDNLSDFEKTKQSLLRSNALLNNSTEKFVSSYRDPPAKENFGVVNREKTKEAAKEAHRSGLVTRNIADCFRDNRKLKFSPPPEFASPRPVAESAETIARKTSDGPSAVGRGGSGARWFLSMFGGGLKLKERLVLAVSIGAVLFTLLLVVDLQLDLGMSGRYVIPSHGRVRYVSQEDGPGSAYNSFRKRFLQKTHR